MVLVTPGAWRYLSLDCQTLMVIGLSRLVELSVSATQPSGLYGGSSFSHEFSFLFYTMQCNGYRFYLKNETMKLYVYIFS